MDDDWPERSENFVGARRCATLARVSGSFIGQKVGDYEVLRRVGSGGMGAVFEARHPVIGKRIAVKVLHPAFAADVKVLERFLNEAKVVNAIGHPAIVDIFSIGQTGDGMPYFLMEFLKGQPLADVIAKEGALPLARALDLTAQLLDVLDKAHAAGVVHRDLKPQNLFVEATPQGRDRLRVLDFGIAKSMTPELRQMLTGSAIVGTPGYMSPEQINSEPVTVRSDLYSVGAVLFELLTSQPVYAGSNIGAILIKALHEAAPRASTRKPDVPAEVDDLVASLLERDPEKRPASAKAALQQVRALEAKLSEHGRLPTREELPAQPMAPRAGPVPGVDDRATAATKRHQPAPRVDPHEVGPRTEPAWSQPREGGDVTKPELPKVSARVPMHDVGAPTAVDPELVARVQAHAAGARPRVLVALLVVAMAGAAVAAWYFAARP